jgi:hypothetical protein
MKIKFRDLYTAINDTRQAVTDMDQNIDNVTCGEAKCIVDMEMERLANSYMNLFNVDVNLNKVDISVLQQEIKDCMSGCTEFKSV